MSFEKRDRDLMRFRRRRARRRRRHRKWGFDSIQEIAYQACIDMGADPLEARIALATSKGATQRAFDEAKKAGTL